MSDSANWMVNVLGSSDQSDRSAGDASLSTRTRHRLPGAEYVAATATESARVHNEAVMTRRERRLYIALTTIAALVIVGFGVVWTRAILAGPMRVVSLALLLLVTLQVMVWGVRWVVLPRRCRPVAMPPRADLRVAAVTTFVSGHEPLEMLELTLRALVAMRKAHDTWLLDEGDDPAVKTRCAELGVRHFSRDGIGRFNTPTGTYRAHSKHGNYNAWLRKVGYDGDDVIAAFDTDHVPEPTYLTRTLGYFADPAIAFAQPAQVYYNQSASFIAQGAAEETYAYYSSHLMASYALGHAIVMGSHCVHRSTALADVGGFPDHDAEDLYLTMLYAVGGWRGVYVPAILARGTTPTDWSGYLKQQLRWSRSVLDLKLRVDAALGDCHEDSEFGLRLFRAGARAVFTRVGGGMHHEIRDTARLLPRKAAEGRADVRLLQRWPELVMVLDLGGRAPRQWRYFQLAHTIGFSESLSTIVPALVLPLLRLMERLKLRGHWRVLQGGLLVSQYWRGVASESGSPATLQERIADAEAAHAAFAARATRCDVELGAGIEQAERLLDNIRPESITIHLHGVEIGTSAPRPEAERLHGGHLRRLLATELAVPFRLAPARSAQRAATVAESAMPREVGEPVGATQTHP